MPTSPALWLLDLFQGQHHRISTHGNLLNELIISKITARGKSRNSYSIRPKAKCLVPVSNCFSVLWIHAGPAWNLPVYTCHLLNLFASVVELCAHLHFSLSVLPHPSLSSACPAAWPPEVHFVLGAFEPATAATIAITLTTHFWSDLLGFVLLFGRLSCV